MTRPAPSVQEIARLGRLDLIARVVVEGLLVGHHRSPYHGYSAEFQKYRQFEPGESIEHVDWAHYRRSGDLFVKVFAERTNLRATLCVDASASMGYTSGDQPSKLDYARQLAAAFAYLLLKQKDAVGLEVFDEASRLSLPARSVGRQLGRILGGLDALRPASGTALGPLLDGVARRLPRRGLVLIFSDLMDDPEPLLQALKHLLYREHEVVVFQILDPRETDFGFRREALFADLERPGETLLVDPAQARADYRERVDAWRRRLRSECRRRRVDLVELDTRTLYDRALLEYLSRRRRVA